jgi:hypothetical protein
MSIYREGNFCIERKEKAIRTKTWGMKYRFSKNVFENNGIIS